MENIHISSWASIIDRDGILWLSDFEFSGLFSMNLITDEICSHGYFSDDIIGKRELHQNVFLVSDELIFSPLFDSCVRIYSKKTSTFSSVPIPNHTDGTEYSPASLIDGYVYFVSDKGVIYKYNTQSRMIDSKDLNIFQVLDNSNNSIFDIISITSYKDGFIIYNKKEKKVAKIDILNDETKIINLTDNIGENVDYIYSDGSEFWITYSNNQIVKQWNNKNNSVEAYIPSREKWIEEKKHTPYSPLFFLKDKVFIPNYYSGYLCKIDVNNKIMNTIDMPKDFTLLPYNGYGATYHSVLEWDQKLYFVPQRGNIIIIMDENTGEIYSKDITIDINELPYYKKILEYRARREEIIMEGNMFFTINSLINSIK